jgi:hypothetical protein
MLFLIQSFLKKLKYLTLFHILVENSLAYFFQTVVNSNTLKGTHYFLTILLLFEFLFVLKF